jgi:translation initiation factor 6
MEIARIRLLGSTYVGLFGITNDKLAFVPPSIEDRALKTVEQTLNVKAVKANIYGSSLLAVFSKMNNKHIYLPSYVHPKELEIIEKEIKARVIPTENALGNLIELNDNGAIISKTLSKKVADEIKKSGLEVAQTNIAKTDIVGSSIAATNKGFVVNPNVAKEEAALLEKVFGVKGGSSTANMGDSFIRNSIIANTNGIIMGENTTPHEINRIEEALMGDEQIR